MKRCCILVLVAALTACAVRGGEVGADEAEAAALAFARQNAILSGHVLGVGEAFRHGAGIWVVPLRPAGYIALEADDARFPVVAFSEENDFPATDLPEALDAALWRMPQPSHLLRAFSLAPEAPRHPAWAALLAPQGGISLLAFTPDTDIETTDGTWGTIDTFTTQWNQCLPWNLYAPGLDTAIVGEGGQPLLGDYGTRCAIGCVALAMAQTAAWFRWPHAFRGVAASGSATDEESDIIRALMVAAPGKPYDWDAIRREDWLPAADSGGAYTGDGAEAARLCHAWATILEMDYDAEGSGGTFATNCRPALALRMGYKMAFKENIRLNPNGSEPDSEDELDPGLHESFRTAIHAYGIPAPTGISGHEIVCYGWADNVDSALTNLKEKYSYAKMNYGWGKGFNGWLGVRDRNDGDGEGLTEDGMVFPMENSAFIPFQCGQIVGLPAQGPLPASIGWYESPYWQTEKAQSSFCTAPTARTLRVATFGGDPTTRVSDLEEADASDPNWSLETVGEETLLTCEDRPGLKAGVLLPELFDGGSTVDIDLRRLTNKDGTLRENAAGVPLVLFLQQEPTGEILELGEVTLSDEEESGTCTIDLPEDIGAFRLCVATVEADQETPVWPIPSAPAFGIASVSVQGTLPIEEAAYALDATVLDSGNAFAALPEGLPVEDGETCWLAVVVGKTLDAARTAGDVLWTPLTIGEEDQPPEIVLDDTIVLGEDPAEPIGFSVWDDTTEEGLTFIVCLSDGLWLGLDPDAEDFDPDAVDNAVRDAGEVAFDDEGNASLTLNLDPAFLDTYAAMGHDAILSIGAEDAAGNIAWAHARLVNRLPSAVLKGMVNESTDPETPLDEWSAVNLDALLYAIEREGEHAAEEAYGRIEDLAAFGYEYNDNLLMSTLPKPAIEVLGVAPAALRFRLIDAASRDVDASAADLAARDIPVTLEAGETLDALAPVEATPTIEDRESGIFEVTPPEAEAAPTRFFRLRAAPRQPIRRPDKVTHGPL